MITVRSMEAQYRFGHLLDTVQREPVTITRHGRTVALMMTPEVFWAQTQPTQTYQDAAMRAGLSAIAATALQCQAVLLHKEILFEAEICQHLASHGWLYAEGDAASYDRNQ